MDPDQTAPLGAPKGAVCSGFIVFVSLTKLVFTAFKYMQQMAFSGQKKQDKG